MFAKPDFLTICSPWLPARKNLTTNVAHPPHGAECMVRGQVDVAFSGKFRRFQPDFAETLPDLTAKSASTPYSRHFAAMFGVARRKLFATKFPTHSRLRDLNFWGRP